MRILIVALLAGLLFHPADASTVSSVSVPLSKVVSESQLIVIGSVERITMLRPPDTTKNDPGLRYFEVRIDEVLKGADQAMVRSEIVPVFDPREMFYHEHADMIAAGVISFVDRRYPTRVSQVAIGDRLVFFIAATAKSGKSPIAGARFLTCGQAYDTLAVKSAVRKRLK
ncbi:MAG: hypothetical protein QOG51_2189 [Verrucomicrobiota bacterium]|jgi:hypothetical protein